MARHADTYQRGGLLVEVISLNSDDEEDRLPVRRPAGAGATRATDRFTAGFRYVGPARPEDARRLGIT